MAVLKYKDQTTGEWLPISSTGEHKGLSYSGIISTSWVENSDTGVKTQTVSIPGMLAEYDANLDHVYTGDDSAESYAEFVEAENQFLTYITNGFAKTVDDGIVFTIFGDANTVEIPIVVGVI